MIKHILFHTIQKKKNIAPTLTPTKSLLNDPGNIDFKCNDFEQTGCKPTT
jgi:hypothetical protein